MNIRCLAASLWLTAAVAGAASAQRSEAPSKPSAALAPQKTADPGLSCDNARDERAAIRTAPAGVKRVSSHVLQVNTPSGIRRFVDKRPYREELSGFHWFYCGYLAALDAHLIGMDDEDLFSGKLLFGRSGRLLDAGQTVYPSPDGKLFLAARQRDGKELEDWMLSDLSGRRLWAGDSGVTTNGVVLVQYENPHWTGGALEVTAICDDRGRTRGEATLVREGRSWRWRSVLTCKP